MLRKLRLYVLQKSNKMPPCHVLFVDHFDCILVPLDRIIIVTDLANSSEGLVLYLQDYFKRSKI